MRADRPAAPAPTGARDRPRRRLASVLAGSVALVLAVAGCSAEPAADAGPGDTSSPGSATATATPTPTGAAVTVSPTRTATPTPTVTRLPAMSQPRKPYPSPTPLPLSTNPSELDHMKWAMEKVVWAALGTADPKTTAFCTTLSKVLVKATAPVQFTCRISAGGVTTHFRVEATKKTDEIAYEFRADKLPVTKKKVDYEAARQVFDPARIRCNVADTKLVRVGDPDEIVCWVRHPNRTRTRYYGELDRYGVLTFRTEQQLRTLTSASPSPTPTSRRAATKSDRAPAKPKAKSGSERAQFKGSAHSTAH